MGDTWYKVLKDGRSFHGGSLEWSLPSTDGPGKWHEVDGSLAVCGRGLHVTSDPAKWMAVGAKVYEAECEVFAGQQQDKACFGRVRLTRELTNDELRELHIAGDGELFVNNALAFAFGSCAVEASGSATVRAFDSATVRAWDSATVEAYGSAAVRAYGSATVRAYGSATVQASGSAAVEAWDSATVEAWDSATVEAWDSATVEASGSATVEAWGSATVRAYGSATVRASGSAAVQAWDSAAVEAWDSATVNVFSVACRMDSCGNAVVIDRRTSPPTVTIGGKSWTESVDGTAVDANESGDRMAASIHWQWWQWYFTKPPGNDEHCKHFWPISKPAKEDTSDA